jgi:tetratricopeptide (TPR) repeat protein
MSSPLPRVVRTQFAHDQGTTLLEHSWTLRGRAVVVVLTAAILSACGAAQSRFEAHLKRGDDYYARADYVKASLEFRNALQIEPRSAKALLEAGRTAEKLGRTRAAVGLLQAAIDAAPDGATPENLAARTDLARLLVLGGSADIAVKTLEPALARRPEDPVLLSLRAAAREQLGDTAGAVADVEHSLRIDPSNSEAIQVRAGLYRRAGDIAAATALVSAAVTKSPRDLELRQALADLYDRGHEPAGIRSSNTASCISRFSG